MIRRLRMLLLVLAALGPLAGAAHAQQTPGTLLAPDQVAPALTQAISQYATGLGYGYVGDCGLFAPGDGQACSQVYQRADGGTEVWLVDATNAVVADAPAVMQGSAWSIGFASPGIGVQPPVTVRAVSNPTLGPILVDHDGLTLYMRIDDGPENSSCTGACVRAWPPLQPPADGNLVLAAGIDGQLSSFMRDDGTMQVEYNGMPLYHFSGDRAPGDTHGQGIAGIWFAATP